MTIYQLVKLGLSHIDSKISSINSDVNKAWEDRYKYVEEDLAAFYVAEDGNTGEALGFITLSHGSIYCKIDGLQKRWPMILIGQIGVDRKFEKQGIGNFLMKEAISICYTSYRSHKFGLRGIYLEVQPDKEYLIKEWYPRFGFEVVENNKNLVAMILEFNRLEPK